MAKSDEAKSGVVRLKMAGEPPVGLGDALGQIAADVSLLFPGGLAELEYEHERSTGRVKVRLRAATAPTRGPVAGDPTVEGDPAFMLKWNIKGHEVIAKLAEDLLLDEEPATHKKLMTFMHADPETTLRSEELRQYAAWPDVMKKDNAFKAKTGKWHYIDIPWDGESDDPPVLPAGPNLLSEYRKQLPLIRGGGNPGKYEALAFITHFVGDIHQPLHCFELHNDEFPKGDAGGNKFLLAHGSNMHSMWDGFVASSSANFATSAGKLKSEYPRSKFTTRLTVKDPQDWILESHAIARDAYREIFAEAVSERASPAYREWGRRVAREQAALAAYRLADVLVQVFANP